MCDVSRSHRDRLIAAAKRLLRERGYASVTARDLVAASGTNLGSIGYHFGTKEALLNEALADVFAEWTRRISDLTATAGGPLERAAGSWVATLDSMPENAPLLRAFVDSLGPALHSPELRGQLAGHYRDLRRQVAGTVAAAYPGGDIAADRAQAVASFMIAIADGFVIQYLLDPGDCPGGEELVAALAAALGLRSGR